MNTFVFLDEEDRPYIKQALSYPNFRVGDKVYLLGSDGSREGLYIIETVVSAEEFTLSLENGDKAQDGEVINVAKLEAV